MKSLLKDVLGISMNVKIKRLKSKGMKIGSNFNMLGGCIIDPSHFWHIEIGDNVTLAPRVHILAHDASTKMFLNYTKVKNVYIGNNVFVGAGTIIMPGVKIGNRVIIGAGSIVTKSIPENSVVVGNPAKYVCSVDNYLEKQGNLMTPDNQFGSEYTLNGNITLDMMTQIKEKIESFGTGFVF